RDKWELNVFAATNAVIALRDAGHTDSQVSPIEEACVEFSDDWRRMLIARETSVEIYALPAVLQAGQLTGHRIGIIPLANASSAYFADVCGNRVITADQTNEALSWTEGTDGNWKSTAIYAGERPVIYAEPDATGSRLIVLEDSGDNFVHGLFYALDARKAWYDLGTEYKFLNATFTDK